MAKRTTLKIKSSMVNMHEVERFVEEVSDEYHLNDNYFGNIIVALTEAVSNAIIHGNKSDENKEVEIVLEPGANGLVFSVTDQGDGFDYSGFLDKEALLMSDEIKGRGILLIHTLADGVNFNEDGTSLEITFRITGIENKIVDDRQQKMDKFLKVKKKVTDKNDLTSL